MFCVLFFALSLPSPFLWLVMGQFLFAAAVLLLVTRVVVTRPGPVSPILTTTFVFRFHNIAGLRKPRYTKVSMLSSSSVSFSLSVAI